MLEYARRAVMLKIVSKVVQCVSHGPMLRAHVPKVLEYARVGRMALVWSNAPYQRCSSGTYGIGAENRVESRAVYQRCSSMRDGL